MIGWLAIALAQEVTEPPPVTEPNPVEDPYEIVVWGEAAIRHARFEVVRAFEKSGWKRGRERNGQVWFRPPSPWMGRASLSYDGELEFHRPVLAMRVLPLDEPRPAPSPNIAGDPTNPDPTYFGGTNAVQGHDAGVVWVLPSWRILEPAHQRARQAVQTDLEAYLGVVEETRRREAAGATAQP